MIRGKFITFEGGDGVGKSTQIRRLAERLKTRGVDSALTREPGGTAFAERVREFIMDGTLPAHGAMSEAFLFAAARFDHVEGVIRPTLAIGQWVLSDRFADSTLAYQGAGGGGDADKLRQLETLTHPGCVPDLTFVLDLDPVIGRTRIAQRGEADTQDPFEDRDLEFQMRLRAAFLAIAQAEPQRCEIIDADRDEALIEADIWQAVCDRFGLEPT